MTTVREPILKPVLITSLRPTQITVGMREVKAKRKRWREKGGKKGAEFLGEHMIPVVLGRKSAITLSIIITSRARCMRRASRKFLSPLSPTSASWSPRRSGS